MEQASLNPYISIVVSGRNDNYGGDFTVRIQNQISWLGSLADKFKLPVEYVLVNYNPLPDQPPLKETLNWPTTKYFKVLQVTVPAQVHKKYMNSEVRKPVPLFEFIAKNAGIRKSTAKFILTTNADILFHPQLFEQLSKQNLEENVIYRTDRLDHTYSSAINLDQGMSIPLQRINKAVFTYFLKGGTYQLKWITRFITIPLKRLQAWNYWAVQPAKKILRKFGEACRSIGIPLTIINRDSLVPCNASGDFLLAHRNLYIKLRGFAEDTYISTHTDSIMLFKFITAGAKVHEFTYPVYHADHQRRFIFDTRLGDADMTKMYFRLQREISEMETSGKPNLHNDQNWGMLDHELLIDQW